MAETHNHLLIYSKSEAFQGALLERSEEQVETYTNGDKDRRGPWLAAPLTRAEHRDRDYYALTNKVGKKVFPPKGSSWRRPPEKMKWLAKEDRIWWGVKGDAEFPMEKKFLSEAKSGVVNQTWWPYEFAGSTRNAGAELKAIFDGSKPFDTPKPTKLIQRVMELTTEVDALILDSFAGSGTTAHAVLAQNAKDGGSRKFILVETEEYADQLTAERVRRVMKGYEFTGIQREELFRQKLTFAQLKKANQLLDQVTLVKRQNESRFDKIKATVKDGELVVTGEKAVRKSTKGLGGGFTYCTLGDKLELDDLLTGKSLPSFEAFGGYLFHTATGQPLDVTRVREADGYLGESAQYHVWLVYRPELDYLKSREAALTLSMAEKIAATSNEKPHLVFAPARFVPQKKLLELGVEHAPLPYALYRIEKA